MSSGFISEKVLEEQRIKSGGGVEPPSSTVQPQDTRSLYHRLQENRMRIQEEREEAMKPKNQFRGIDSEEADFLEHVDHLKMDTERNRIRQEKQEIEEYRKQLKKTTENDEELEDLNDVVAAPRVRKPRESTDPTSHMMKKVKSQTDLLKNALKRKTSSNTDTKKVEHVDGATIDQKAKMSKSKSETANCLVSQYSSSEEDS